MGVFADKEESELEGPVLGVVARNEVGLRFRHVKGQAVGFRKKGDKENEGRKGLVEDCPLTAESQGGVRLAFDDGQKGSRCPPNHMKTGRSASPIASS
jgi:hypothetical protein